MKTKAEKNRTLSALLTLVSLTALSSPALAQSASEVEESEEIVVTGLKRDGMTEVNAPAAVSVISGDQIDELAATSLTDFLQLAPGLALDEQSNSTSSVNIGIRGINSNFGSASVGFYIDGLPFSFTNVNLVPDVNPFDIGSIEVLRGPQGSLYGAGSSGGVVIVRTRDPNLDELEGAFDVFGSSTEGGGFNSSLSGAVSMPIVEDILAVRVAVSYQQNEGFVDDGFDAPVIADDIGEDFNDSEDLNVRAKILFQPTNRLSLNLLGNFRRSEATGSGLADDSLNFPMTFAPTDEVDLDQFGLTAEYDLGFAQLTNIVGYLDFSNFSIGQSAAFIPVDNQLQSFSNELRLASTGDGPVSWVGGLFYRKMDQQVSQVELQNFGLPFNFVDDANSEQVSVFGEATLALLDGALEITAGGSYFWDDSSQTTAFPLNALGDLLGAPQPADLPASLVETRLFSPKASIAYHPTPRSTVYFSYSEGFRSGFNDFGISTLFAQNAIAGGGGDPSIITGRVGAEEIRAYEVGAKGELFGGLVYVELALYLNELTDTQQSALVVDPGGAFANTAINAGPAETSGVEWLLRLNEPIRGLNVSFSGTVINAELTEDFFAGPLLVFADGQRLNATPELIMNGSASYTFPVAASGWDATVSGNLQYSDQRSLTALGQAPVLGDEIFRADLRFQVERDNLQFYLFAQNITDEQGRVMPSSLQPIVQAFGFPFDGNLGTRIRPLTLGGGVRFSF